ncbi:MAG TPA: hypothetical protein VL501_05200, partial [Pyrinomonadaceae bacterium]|nr:hypothetical protein [Pyrinomonadaceae bacterium]
MLKGRNSVLLIAVAILATQFFANNGTHAAAAGPGPLAVPTPDKSLFSEYRGIKIGTAADDVRTKLGAPKEKADAQDFFVFSDSESAQFYYDPKH